MHHNYGMDNTVQPLDVPVSQPSGAPAPAATHSVSPIMDREYVDKNRIVERYLAGRLSPRGVTDFERFCREHPELLDAIGLPERVNAGLRLLEAGGKPEPWAERPKSFWEKPALVIGLAAATFATLVVIGVLAVAFRGRGVAIAALEERIATQPLAPATARRTIKLLPSRTGPTTRAAVYVGEGATQFIDLKIDVSWSKFQQFRVLIERVGQGRVALVHNLQKDSNGDLRLAFNSSALGPGQYLYTIEGLTWRGEAVGQAWITVGVQR